MGGSAGVGVGWPASVVALGKTQVNKHRWRRALCMRWSRSAFLVTCFLFYFEILVSCILLFPCTSCFPVVVCPLCMRLSRSGFLVSQFLFYFEVLVSGVLLFPCTSGPFASLPCPLIGHSLHLPSATPLPPV